MSTNYAPRSIYTQTGQGNLQQLQKYHNDVTTNVTPTADAAISKQATIPTDNPKPIAGNGMSSKAVREDAVDGYEIQNLYVSGRWQMLMLRLKVAIVLKISAQLTEMSNLKYT